LYVPNIIEQKEIVLMIKMVDEKGIKTNWSKVKLGEVATYINGKAFKPSDWSNTGLPIIRIQNLNRDKSEFNYCNFPVDEKFYVHKGDLLFAWSGTPDTSFGAHIWKGEKAVLNQHIFRIVIDEKKIRKKYYLHALNNKVKEFVNKAHGTAGLAHITKKKFEESEIYLPPLPHQDEIVTKVEELLSELDKGIEQLKTAQQQLKVYRQSVLKWAFEGKLTNENVQEGELPKGWKWEKLGAHAFVTKLAGFEFTKYVKYKEQGDIPVIRAQNVSKEGFVERNWVYVDREIMEKLPRSRVYGEEILMVFVGAGLGNVGIVPNNKEFFLGPNVSKIAVNKNCYNKFIYYFLTSKLGFGNVSGMSKATAQGSISMGNIREVIVPIIPFEEQKQIVQEIESRLSVADKLEETINNSLQQAEALRQSILKKAFEGEL